jgi:DNA-directed RNA polymerase subunit F
MKRKASNSPSKSFVKKLKIYYESDGDSNYPVEYNEEENKSIFYEEKKSVFYEYESESSNSPVRKTSNDDKRRLLEPHSQEEKKSRFYDYDSDSPVVHCHEDRRRMLEPHFPGAITNMELIGVIRNVIEHFQNRLYQDDKDRDIKILLATSCCSDEINRDLDIKMDVHLSRPFQMGGLAGFPFTGKTGFGAFQDHVPDKGIMFVVLATHIGVDSNGEFGVVDRVGCHPEKESKACGSAIKAFTDLDKMSKERIAWIATSEVYDELDFQQGYVKKKVAKIHHSIVTEFSNKMVGLATKLSEETKKDLLDIMPKKKDANFKLILLHGVQINFEGENSEDFFFPMSFEYYHGDQISSLDHFLEGRGTKIFTYNNLN